jgi:hypothetical protein
VVLGEEGGDLECRIVRCRRRSGDRVADEVEDDEEDAGDSAEPLH